MSKPKQQEDVSFYWRMGEEQRANAHGVSAAQVQTRTPEGKVRRTFVPGQGTKASHPNGSLGACALRLTASKRC